MSSTTKKGLNQPKPNQCEKYDPLINFNSSKKNDNLHSSHPNHNKDHKSRYQSPNHYLSKRNNFHGSNSKPTRKDFQFNVEIIDTGSKSPPIKKKNNNQVLYPQTSKPEIIVNKDSNFPKIKNAKDDIEY